MKKKRMICTATALLMALSLCACKTDDAPSYSAADASVWCAPSSEKILATEKPSSYASVKSDAVRLIAARNDYESAQILVSADKDIAFTVSLGDLKCGNNVIKKENFKVYTQRYMTVLKNWNGNGSPTGEYPDAIIPQETAAEFGLNRVAAGKNGGAWLEFYIPGDTPAGDYEGTATVHIGKDDVSVPVRLKVYGVSVPEELTSKSLFTVSSLQVAVHELDNSVGMVEKYEDLLIDYKISPSGLYLGSKGNMNDFVEKAFYSVVEKGLSTIGLPYYGGEEIDGFKVFGTDVLAEYLVALAEKSLTTENEEKQVNLLSKAAFYDWHIDEPFYNEKIRDGEVSAHVKAWKTTVEKAQAALRAKTEFSTEFGRELIESVGQVAHVITDYGTDEYGNAHRTAGILKDKNGDPYHYETDGSDYVNLCPKPDGYASDDESAFYENGREKWWYNCNTPGHPYVTYHMDASMASAISIGWMMAQHDITGNLYWATNNHVVNGNNLEDAYTVADRGQGAVGDGFLIYPGSYYGLSEPVASIRLDAIRDGQEDYELLKMLKAAYAQKGFDATSVIKTVTKNFYSESSIVGGAVEYEASRELMLQLLDAALSPAQFMLTSVTETETPAGKQFTVKAAAAEGVKLYDGNTELVREGNEFTVTKGLTENENYYSVRVVEADGTEHSFTLYLGGKEIAYAPDSFTRESFKGDIGSYEFANGYHMFTLAKQPDSIMSDEKLRLDFTHESLSGISVSTANYILNLYNATAADINFEIQLEYEGYGLEAAQAGVLRQGENRIELNFFASMNWKNKGKITKMRIVLSDGNQIGVGGIKVYGV